MCICGKHPFNHYPETCKSAYHVDSFISILINTIVFGTLAVTVETQIEGSGYFWFIMALIVLTGATTSFFQNSVFSEASQLPPMYMQAVLRYLELRSCSVFGTELID